MQNTIQHARVTGSVAYVADSGRRQNIPLGPCLVERIGGKTVEIIWGERGQRCAALPVEAVEAARNNGHLVLLD